MKFSKVVRQVKDGRWRLLVHREKAVDVCHKTMHMPRKYRWAYRFWYGMGLVFVIGGPILFFWIPKWIGAIVAFSGMGIIAAARRGAVGFVYDYALSNKKFFSQMLNEGVIKIDEKGQ